MNLLNLLISTYKTRFGKAAASTPRSLRSAQLRSPSLWSSLGWDLGDPWTVAALCVIAAISERGLVRLTSTTSQSISILPTLFAAVLFGPLAGMVVGAASLAGEVLQPPHLKWVTYTSSRAISGAVTGLAASFCLTLSSSDFVGTAVATLVGAVVAEVLDIVFAAIAAQRARHA